MARIVIADDGIAFDGHTLEQRPLGGVESAVIELSRALAALGHDVTVCNMCEAPDTVDGVAWRPIHGRSRYDGLPGAADLYVANRGDRLIPLLPAARRRAFWMHNPARYVLKWRYLSKLWRWRPTVVFIGAYHAETLPGWVPDGGRAVIPYGVGETFRSAAPATEAPAPRAIFTSNPLRGLDRLLELWSADIRPRVPGAELHVFSGSATYGRVGDAKAEAMNTVLDRARALSDQGVVLRDPVPKETLVGELRASRVMLYRGDLNETFCAAVAEAQALGVPAVVCRVGSLSERVIDGETGYVAGDDAAFAERAVDLLSDDALWRRQHEAALARQRSWGWPDAARAFERLLDG